MELRAGNKYRLGRRIGSRSFGDIYIEDFIEDAYSWDNGLNVKCVLIPRQTGHIIKHTPDGKLQTITRSTSTTAAPATPALVSTPAPKQQQQQTPRAATVSIRPQAILVNPPVGSASAVTPTVTQNRLVIPAQLASSLSVGQTTTTSPLSVPAIRQVLASSVAGTPSKPIIVTRPGGPQIISAKNIASVLNHGGQSLGTRNANSLVPASPVVSSLSSAVVISSPAVINSAPAIITTSLTGVPTVLLNSSQPSQLSNVASSPGQQTIISTLKPAVLSPAVTLAVTTTTTSIAGQSLLGGQIISGSSLIQRSIGGTSLININSASGPTSAVTLSPVSSQIPKLLASSTPGGTQIITRPLGVSQPQLMLRPGTSMLTGAGQAKIIIKDAADPQLTSHKSNEHFNAKTGIENSLLIYSRQRLPLSSIHLDYNGEKEENWTIIPVKHLDTSHSCESDEELDSNNSSRKRCSSAPRPQASSKKLKYTEENYNKLKIGNRSRKSTPPSICASDENNSQLEEANNMTSVVEKDTDSPGIEKSVSLQGCQVSDDFKMNLAKENRKIDHIEGDGNCLFRCLSKDLYNTEMYHKGIRICIVDFIRTHASKFSQFVDNEDVEEHISMMCKDGSWGTSCEIYAAATFLQRDIFVLTPDHNNENYTWMLFQPLFKIHAELTSMEACQSYLTICNTNSVHFDRIISVHGGCNCYLPHPELDCLSTNSLTSVHPNSAADERDTGNRES